MMQRTKRLVQDIDDVFSKEKISRAVLLPVSGTSNNEHVWLPEPAFNTRILCIKGARQS